MFGSVPVVTAVRVVTCGPGAFCRSGSGLIACRVARLAGPVGRALGSFGRGPLVGVWLGACACVLHHIFSSAHISVESIV